MLNQVHPVNKIHPYNHFSEYFFVFLQIYCANMEVEHGLSSRIIIFKLIRINMRKESRAMDSQWALEVMHKAPYMTASFIDEDGKRKQYDKEGVEMKYGRME